MMIKWVRDDCESITLTNEFADFEDIETNFYFPFLRRRLESNVENTIYIGYLA